MNDKVPTDNQDVDVLVGDDVWQQATYKDSGFVDAYGIPLDRSTISNWRPHIAAPADSGSSASAKHV